MMKKLALIILFGILGVGVYGQTIKSLGFNTTNGQVVANTGTNVLQFTNNVSFQGGLLINGSGAFYVSATNGGLNLEEGLITDISNNAVLSWSDSTILSVGRALSFANTANAATTRTNLGLGWSALTNTNATNFRTAIGFASSRLTTAKAFDAEYYDDFSAYPDGTLITNGFSPIIGSNYSLIYYAATNASPLAPVITNGMLRPSGTNNPPDGNETYYLTSVLPSNIRSWGADVKWNVGNTPYSSIVFLIRTNNDFLGNFLHLTVSQTQAALQWSTNGAGGLVTEVSTNFATQLPSNKSIKILGSIKSNIITLDIDGRIVKGTNSNFAALAGRWFTFEQYGYGLYGITSLAEVERVWANASWQDVYVSQNEYSIYKPELFRTNLGLGWSALTNTNASNFRSAIGLGPTNNVTFADITASGVVAGFTYGSAFIAQDTNIYPIYTNTVISVSGFDGLQFHNPIGETNLANILATKTRTNLGLGGGITTNRTFVSYNGTNYTTNSVTISNGIITGWTQ
jgi:hypothetical protein